MRRITAIAGCIALICSACLGSPSTEGEPGLSSGGKGDEWRSPTAEACPVGHDRGGAESMQRCDLSGDPEADGCGCSDDARSWCDPTLVRDGDWCVPEMPLCSFGEPGEACVYDGEPLPEGTRVGLHLCVHGEWLIVADCGAYSDRSACVDTPGCGYCTRAAGPTECVEGSLHGPFGEIEPCDEWVPAMVECPLS